MKGLLTAGLLGLAAYGSNRYKADTKSMADPSAARHAVCLLHPELNSTVSGIVAFSQEAITKPTLVVANVSGFKPNTKHGFHIHEFGDLTDGCHSAGDHFNPYNKLHGGPGDAERHVGDMGNLTSDAHGLAKLKYEDPLIKLFGDTNIIGRSVVVHADEDDFGRGSHVDSKSSGHSGARVACGVIGFSKSFKSPV